MHTSFRHSRWSFFVVALLIVGSLPRFGCVCANGSHLAFCQKLVHHALNQLGNSFCDSAKPKKCPCCGNRHSESVLPQHGCNDSEDPCECRVTLEGPQWNSSDRVELPASDLLAVYSPMVNLSLFSGRGIVAWIQPVDSGPPPLLNRVETVRLNV